MKNVKGFRGIVVFTLFTMAISFWATAIEAGSPTCEARNNNNSKKLLECVTLEGVATHLAAFQAIANAYNGNRSSGTDGYDFSADYVVEQLATTGRYNVIFQEFDFVAFRTLSPSALEQVSPTPQIYTEGVHYRLMEYSGAGNVTAPVTAVDVLSTTSGCEASDFAGFPAGNIALIRRGTCTFRDKATNAQNAGAVGVIVFNNNPDSGLFGGTLLAPGITIPVFSTPYALGVELASIPGLVLHMKADVISVPFTTMNIIAETVEGRSDKVVVVGAQLDSFWTSPGINNASGAATILEIALQMKNVKPVNKVRFIWFGAETEGQKGSEYYVSQLSELEKANIALYLDFVFIGSPNFVRFILDGDDAIQAQFESFYSAIGVPYQLTGGSLPTELSFGSFDIAGIPYGGLFTGTAGIKTAEEALTYGGTAGQAYDACFYLLCDTYGNVNLNVLDQNADAAAFAVIENAMGSTSGKVKIKNQPVSPGFAIPGPAFE